MVEELTREKERYRTLVETSPDAIGIIDEDGTIVFCNQQTCELFGYARSDDLIGRNLFLDLFAPEDLQRALEDFETLQYEGKIRNLVYTLVKQDRTRFIGEVHGSILSPPADQAPTFLGTIRDVTRYKKSEETIQRAYTELSFLNRQIRRSRDLFSALIDGLKDGLVLLDHTGNVLAVNQALARLLNTTPAKMVQCLWDDVCKQAVPPFPGEDALLFLEHRQKSSYRVTYPAADGKEYILDIKTSLLEKSEQQRLVSEITNEPPYSIIIHVIDVTEQFQIEAKLIQNERFATSGRLAATVAHEVNGPLQAMRALFHLMRRAQKEERDLLLDDVDSEIERVGRILHQLLDFCRPGPDHIVPLNVNGVIERVLFLSSGTLAKQRIVVERHLAKHLPRLQAQPDALNQIVLNLLLNAIEAMPDGGTLRVQTDLQTENNDTISLIIKISDTGVGISPDVQNKIFTPFFTTKKDGTGIGLTVCQNLVSQYDGYIVVQNNQRDKQNERNERNGRNGGGGTTFMIVFPLVRTEETNGAR
jgi:PAS domain S-box-containing protein